MFPSNLKEIEAKVLQIDPVRYGFTRNFSDGSVTKLSPYISRGVISTKRVFEHLLSLDLPWNKIEKLVQELAWRDYWQQIWIAKGDAIDKDLKRVQQPISTDRVPEAIINHHTQIEAIDLAIKDLYNSGYMHNHMRMYVAALACNVAQAHWFQPAKWMYSHLLDGDWASNALSWQWVAGANANKKYYANQQNINRYFNSDQKQTYLDIDYDEFYSLPVPDALKKSIPFEANTLLPAVQHPTFDPGKKILIYNYYNLDPYWHQNEDFQRVLLLEPSFFNRYPVNPRCIDFILKLSENIRNLKVFVGEFHELEKEIETQNLVFKEHPTNCHYRGSEEARDWMFDVTGFYSSFFSFWKKCKKQIS